MAEDAALHSDSGGKRAAAINPIRGADKIIRFFAAIARKEAALVASETRPATVNGLAGFVIRELLSTNGLGAFLVRSQENFRIDDVLAALLLIVVVALFINLTTEAIQRKLLAWHHASAGVR